MLSRSQHLIFKALVALDEVKDASREGVIKPTFALRFCLAYLFAHSDGRRDPFDGFWQAIQDPHVHSRDGGAYLRPTTITTNMNGILNGLGINSTPELVHCIAQRRSADAGVRFWAEVQRQVDQGDPMPTFRGNRPKRSRSDAT